MRRLGCWVLGLGLMAVEGRALACWPPRQRAVLSHDVPAENVPTNAGLRYAIRAQRDLATVDEARPELVEVASRQLVPVTVETVRNQIVDAEQVFVVHPELELKPRTEYRLVHYLSLATDSAGDDRFVPSAEAQQIARFFTGEGPDHVAPAFGGLDQITVDERDSSGDGECSSSGYSFVKYSFQQGKDDTGVSLRYHVVDFATGEVLVRYTNGPFSVRPCDSPLRDPGTAVLVRAVDLAGNLDDNFVMRRVPLSAACSCWCSFGPGARRPSGFEWQGAALLALAAIARLRRRSARAQALLELTDEPSREGRVERRVAHQ